MSGRDYIVTNEDWMSTNRLETSSLQEKRKKGYGQDLQRKLDQQEEYDIEMQKKRTVEGEMQNTKDRTRDCSQQAGRYKKDGNKEDLTKLAWSFWKGMPAHSEDRIQITTITLMQRRLKTKLIFKKEGRKPSKWKIQ